jgi:hypothetical protein
MDLKNALLLGLGALVGCAGTDHPSSEKTDEPVAPSVAEHPTADPAAALAHVDENLARLKALSVFEVGELVVAMPEEAWACYGPCPGSEKAIAQAKEDAAVRLDKLASVAEKAASATPADACEKDAIDQNLAALAALAIVGVAGLVEEQPHNNPQCYNLPCQSDIDAAAKVTCERAGKLANIVGAAKGL